MIINFNEARMKKLNELRQELTDLMITIEELHSSNVEAEYWMYDRHAELVMDIQNMETALKVPSNERMTRSPEEFRAMVIDEGDDDYHGLPSDSQPV